MTTGGIRDRRLGAVSGLAIGDAAGWPARRHRARSMAAWSRRLGRELDAFAEEHGVTTLPVPFALNQPVEPLRPGPSDDTEWLAWTLLTQRTHRTDRAGAFAGLAGRDDVTMRISTKVAVENLARGLAPPQSGHDNPHFFDDAAAVRAVAYGVLEPGDPAAAAARAREDAEVTNAGDGVLGAAAIAAAVASAVTGGSPDEVISEALDRLPQDTAIGHATRRALRLEGPAFAVVPELEDAVHDHVYSYGVAAAATVPVALALTAASGGELSQAVPAAACIAPLADSAPALTGALTGAITGHAAVPWPAERFAALAGCCLPELAGMNLIELTEGTIR